MLAVCNNSGEVNFLTDMPATRAWQLSYHISLKYYEVYTTDHCAAFCVSRSFEAYPVVYKLGTDVHSGN